MIGNYLNDPLGTNRLLLTVYTAVPVTGIAIDGEPIDFDDGAEAGWYASTTAVVIPACETRSLSLVVAGTIEPGAGLGSAPDPYQLVIGTQPLVDDPTYSVRVTGPASNDIPLYEGLSPGHQWHAAVATPTK